MSLFSLAAKIVTPQSVMGLLTRTGIGTALGMRYSESFRDYVNNHINEAKDADLTHRIVDGMKGPARDLQDIAEAILPQSTQDWIKGEGRDQVRDIFKDAKDIVHDFVNGEPISQFNNHGNTREDSEMKRG